ncbi:MAG: permease, partial [Chloroflexi bacterium]
AEMDMSVSEGSLWQKIFSARGFTAVSHLFVMDWASVIRDVVGGLLIAGALAAWVPETFWKVFFLSDEPRLAFFWGPLVGPIVSVVSFVCSIGNVPLAAVLWNNGISFGGVISFIFADLIILPILSIKRKYYGTGVTVFLFATFYAAMALAGLLVELLFGALGLIPHERNALVIEPSLSWNYTTVLNFLFLALAGVLLFRAWRTGGFAMLGMMNPKDATTRAETAHHH